MTSDVILDRIWRAIRLDSEVFVEVYEDRAFTSVAAASVLSGVILAALGALLYADTVLDFRPSGWIADTLVLGTIFTLLLMAAAIALTYVILVQAFSLNVSPEGLGRVMAFTFGIYGLGFFVFLPEVGFTAGLMSLALTFHYAVSAVRAVVPGASGVAAMTSVAAGFALWISVMALVAEPPNNHFYTGVFVYSLLD